MEYNRMEKQCKCDNNLWELSRLILLFAESEFKKMFGLAFSCKYMWGTKI